MSADWPCPRCRSRRHHLGACPLGPDEEMEWRVGRMVYADEDGEVTHTFPEVRYCWEWARQQLESREGSFLLEGERLWTSSVDAGGHSISEAEVVLTSWTARCRTVMARTGATELHVLAGDEHWRPNRVL